MVRMMMMMDGGDERGWRMEDGDGQVRLCQTRRTDMCRQWLLLRGHPTPRAHAWRTRPARPAPPLILLRLFAGIQSTCFDRVYTNALALCMWVAYHTLSARWHAIPRVPGGIPYPECQVAYHTPSARWQQNCRRCHGPYCYNIRTSSLPTL